MSNRGKHLKETEIARWGSREAWIEQLKLRGAKGGRAEHTGLRGFASMDKDKLKQIASKGGKNRHGKTTHL